MFCFTFCFIYTWLKTVHLPDIYPGLFVGDINCGRSVSWLEENQINLMICLVENETALSGIAKIEALMDDTSSAGVTLIKLFKKTVYPALENAVKNNENILIHCSAGRSRYAY
jgi:hypothetical protein